MKNAFVELEELIREWDSQQTKPLNSGQRMVLVEIGRREYSDVETRATDLIQQIRFGTGPTIHSHLLRLEAVGLLAKSRSKIDGRAVCVYLTKAGRDYLKALDRLVRAAVK